MLGVWSATVGLAAAAGPLGGVLIHWLGWRSVFLINVPVGLLGLLMAQAHCPSRRACPHAAPVQPSGRGGDAGGSVLRADPGAGMAGARRASWSLAVAVLAAVALVRMNCVVAPLLPRRCLLRRSLRRPMALAS
jgi:DHA2 family methylenomycin A resistance protein-like MFS transporter